MQTQKNKVFKIFMIFCALLSAFIIYFLIVRPLKIVVEASENDSDIYSFIYDQNEVNPNLEEFNRRSKNGGHVVVVLLTPTKKLLTNYKYPELIMAFEKCKNELPCPVIEVDKKSYLDKARPRKDLKK